MRRSQGIVVVLVVGVLSLGTVEAKPASPKPQTHPAEHSQNTLGGVLDWLSCLVGLPSGGSCPGAVPDWGWEMDPNGGSTPSLAPRP
jgi:hypothetical protein